MEEDNSLMRALRFSGVRAIKAALILSALKKMFQRSNS